MGVQAGMKTLIPETHRTYTIIAIYNLSNEIK